MRLMRRIIIKFSSSAAHLSSITLPGYLPASHAERNLRMRQQNETERGRLKLLVRHNTKQKTNEEQQQQHEKKMIQLLKCYRNTLGNHAGQRWTVTGNVVANTDEKSEKD